MPTPTRLLDWLARSLQSALAELLWPIAFAETTTGARPFYIGDPATAKLEISAIMGKKTEYDLDKDGVLDELELAMEKEAQSTWAKINTWSSTHPPTFKRILLLHEIEMESGRFTVDRTYEEI